MVIFAASLLFFLSGVIFGYTRIQDALWQANSVAAILVCLAILLLAFDYIEGR